MKKWCLAVLLIVIAVAVALGGMALAAAKAPAKGAPKAPPPATPKADQPKDTGGGTVTDAQVRDAIEKGRAYLIDQAQGDGSFKGAGGESGAGGVPALVFMTLAYMGEHPNKPYMEKGLDYLLNLNADTGFGQRQGYAVPIRIMGFSYVHNKLLGDKRTAVRQKMTEDVMRLVMGQTTGGAGNGGWRYKLNATDYDFSVTQWPILAFREANLVGIEFPSQCLVKARALYLSSQNADGGWHYQKGQSYGSMTAAGLASLFIITDVLEPASGCPCRNGQSGAREAETEKAIDRALGWFSKNFTTTNPNSTGTPGNGKDLYWMYCLERVGMAAGYKYFGNHNWYKEGAHYVLGKREGDHWGEISNTCFSLLFLYKGRASIIFNKLRFNDANGKAGEWNNHRRDIANLTSYIEKKKELPFQWQITDLQAPLDELHDAPILYISAESAPNFSDADKKKLRQFTDTGGTILFEASCGNAAVKKWFTDFAKEVWPEWPLKPLASEHGSFNDTTPLKQRPEIFGIDDGMRTFVFYAGDDISCTWQTKAVAAREYIFQWGMNLMTYASDHSPLRAKLSDHLPPSTNRFAQPVKAGPKTTIKVARVKYAGNWEVNTNYGGLRHLAEHIKSKAGITLDVNEPKAVPFNTGGGVAPTELGGYDVAYLAGSGAIGLKPEEKSALKSFVEKGGFLWIEDAGGSSLFDQALRPILTELGWTMKLLPNTAPLMTGNMESATGYNLAAGLEFRYSLRIARLSRPCAEYYGIYAGEKMIGVYSPLDVTFSSIGYDSYNCKGYKHEDAAAVATNLAIYLSTLK